MIPQFIYIESFGCAANQNNTEIIKGMLIQAGLELTNNPEIADILIINTCIVKGKIEKSIEHRISVLSKLGKPLIVAGCMPEVRKLPGVYTLGTHNFKQILNLIKDISEGNDATQIGNYYLKKRDEIKLNLPKIKERKTIGITQILEGCNGDCNYCIVKLAKGKLYCYPEERILNNIQADLASGCKEIWLTSQDNAAYPNLPDLINKITSIPANFKLRIGMMNPNNILPIIDKLIEAYKNKKVFKFLHIPIQSGSDKILQAMNRKYTIEQVKLIINKFKQAFPDTSKSKDFDSFKNQKILDSHRKSNFRDHQKSPISDITISTDIIAGYPGESEEDYQASLKLLEEISPDIFNISRYWPIKGTKAALLPQIPAETAKKRAKALHDLHLKITKQNYEKYKLTHPQVWALIDDKLGKSFLARDDNYKLVIINQETYLNKFVRVKLGKVYPHYFLGEIVQI